jgi:hypothetical protein
MSRYMRFITTLFLFCSISAVLADPPSGPAASRGDRSSKKLLDLIESMYARSLNGESGVNLVFFTLCINAHRFIPQIRQFTGGLF